MILFPAIDLRAGRCVRLLHGDFARETVYGDDPAAQARAFMDAGCQWLHVVDLDGARSGGSPNRAAIEAILAAIEVPVQLGGGLRDLNAIEGWLARGVARVILGTAAVRDPDLLATACRRFPGRVAVAIDARDGRVALAGWESESSMPADELAARAADAGAAALIYTDIGRDGALAGPNIDATLALARAVPIPVVASGGVATLDDLRALARAARADERAAIEGVIVGRALYDGRIELKAALAALRGSGSC